MPFPRKIPAPVSRDWLGASLLAILGVGTRLAFVTAYPTQPFWDFLGIVDFAALLRDRGFVARGWHWSQFNPGLPMILAALFRAIPRDQTVVARTATAVTTGLLPLFPFLLWRRSIAYPWRFLAGILLALWPGQVFFSGVVAQDNWVLLPTIALASLAVTRLLGAAPPRPVVAGLLYAAAVAIRQEMALALVPVLLPAAVGGRTTRDRRHNFLVLAFTVVAAMSLLVAQRFLATGRLAITTEHGALGLYGSFMPGASEEGWIDGRAYANALYPGSAGRELFGHPATLLRMTWNEISRRPAFHLLRISSWLPRLALESDAGNLRWSLGVAQAQLPDRRESANRIVQAWRGPLRWELAFLQGLFVATVAIGIARRSAPILVLATAVLLKFAIHLIVSPLDRLMVPAIALELLVIPLGMAEFAHSSALRRAAGTSLVLGTTLALLLAVPRLAEFVIRHDSPVLPGIRQFALRLGGGGVARCTLESGALTGIGPKWAGLRTTTESPLPGETATVSCALPDLCPRDLLSIRLHDPIAPRGLGWQRTVQVEIDSKEVGRMEMVGDASNQVVELPSGSSHGQPRIAAISVLAGPPGEGARPGRDASVRFEFERREPPPSK